MHLDNIKDVEAFLEIVNSCDGDVVLTSVYGDVYNLKSALTQYVAIGALLGEGAGELELRCSDRADEEKFLKFFKEQLENARG